MCYTFALHFSNVKDNEVPVTLTFVTRGMYVVILDTLLFALDLTDIRSCCVQ